MAGTHEGFPYGNETTLTAGINAVLDVMEGEEPCFPFGNETVETAGFNAIISGIDSAVLGHSPTLAVTQTATGATVTATDKDGTTSAEVSNGQDGRDYVLTAQDKADIAALVEADYANGDTAEY